MAQKAILLFCVLFVLGSIPLSLTTTTSGAETGLKEWTFIVYLDADNNLEDVGIEDLNEMEVVGSSDEVNVVVLMDRAIGYDTSNGDWTDAKLFYVTKDADGKDDEIDSEVLRDMGEINMGDPNTLVDFVTWAARNYPANHYLLDLWDHGGAFYGVCWDDGNESEADDDYLSMVEVGTALSAITEDLGRDIDILGYDACSMSAASVRYQTLDQVDITIGSGPFEPGEGWPYHDILQPLVADPTMSPEALASHIVDVYVESYEPGQGEEGDVPDAAMAAYDMHEFNNVAARLDEFAMALASNSGLLWQGGNYRQIESSIELTHHYDVANFGPVSLGYGMYDLRELAYWVAQQPNIDALIKDRAQALIAAIDAACINSRTTIGRSSGHSQIGGLSIYLPVKATNTYDSVYDELAFAKDKYWDEFIHYYNSKQSAPDTPPAISIISPVDDYVVYDRDKLLVISGTAFDVDAVVHVEVRINEGGWQRASGTTDWRYYWSPPDSGGEYIVQARAYDGSQYSTVASVKTHIASGTAGSTGIGIELALLALGLGAGLIVAALMVWRRRRSANGAT